MGKIIVAICLLIALWLIISIEIDINFPKTADALSEIKRHIDELIAEKIRNEDVVAIEIKIVDEEGK